MPELPEVETTLRGIEPYVIGKVLSKVVVRNASLRWPIPTSALIRLEGQRVVKAERRAKYIILYTDLAAILLHLGMSGSLRVLDAGTEPGKHDHLDLEFEQLEPQNKGSASKKIIRLNDPRRFGCCLCIDLPIESHSLLASLGPEPLSDGFNGEVLFERSRGRKQAVKNFIMDGKTVVGVGNIYASESLFQAGIRPTMAAGRVSKVRYQTLAATIKAVLSKAINAGGTSLNDFTQTDGKPGYFKQELQVYGRAGEACNKCADTIQSKVIGQRSTFFCRQCQSF